jgi:hypothetical protein
MARLTGNNSKRDVYLPYQSTEDMIREAFAKQSYKQIDEPIRAAIEQHESEVKVYGWVFFVAFFLLLMLHDAFLYYAIKVL